MVIFKQGNILNADERVICHQCNLEGVFGGGLALQIKNSYPSVEASVMMFSQMFLGNTLGMVHYVDVDSSRTFANCFSQNEDYTTNYEMLEKCFNEVFGICSHEEFSVAIPYKYGCGIAKGDWDTVLGIITELSNKWGLNVSIYCLEGVDFNENNKC